MVSSNMRILILGAGGMLGSDLALEFASYNPVLWDKDELDITDEKAVREKIFALHPTVIINAAAYTNVDGAEENKELADKINHQAVGFIAQAAQLVGAKVVQISTEYVFAGDKKEGYDEDDKPDPLNVYGLTKYLGEQVLMRLPLFYYIVRTSWLYGQAPQKGKPRGMNFIDTILHKARSGEDLRVVNDQFGHPTFTKDLAHGIHQLLLSDKPAGIYHIVNEGVTSWYGLATYVLHFAGIDVKIKPCSSAEFPTPAARPHYAVLNNNKLPPFREWRQAVAEYLTTKYLK